MDPAKTNAGSATGFMIDLSTHMLLLLGGFVQGTEAAVARQYVQEAVARLRGDEVFGPWRLKMTKGRAQARWQAIRAGLAEAFPLGDRDHRQPDDVLRALADFLGDWMRDPSSQDGKAAAALRDALAFGWWGWSEETGEGALQWERHRDRVPNRDDIMAGLIACAADAARLQVSLQGRVRPIGHPLRRVIGHLGRHLSHAQGVIEATASLLRSARPGGRESASDRALTAEQTERALREVAWQRLCWIRTLLARLHDRLVYLPAGEVEPVLYTVLEDVFGTVDGGLTLTAVPAEKALAGFRFRAMDRSFVEGGLGSELAVVDEVVPVAVHDLAHPLAWPLLARAFAFVHSPIRDGSTFAAGAEGTRKRGGGVSPDPDLIADAIGVATFGPSYPLALATAIGGRRPMVGADWLPKRLDLLSRWLRERGLEDATASRWMEAMVRLIPPFRREAVGASEHDSPLENGGDMAAFWDRWQDAGFTLYSPQQVAVAAALQRGLQDGQLISSLREVSDDELFDEMPDWPHSLTNGQTVPEEALEFETEASAGVGALYEQLRRVHDIPARSAEIVHAGWMFFLGGLRDRLRTEWLDADPSQVPPMNWDEVVRQLAGTDALIYRSLDVAAVHRLYSQEMTPDDPQ